MTDGRGYGLFTTTSVKAGDLLLCEKAFAYLGGSTETMLDEAQLVLLIVQKLRQNPSPETNIGHLDCKTESPIITRRRDGSTLVNL